jgi:hypothetical protein
MEIVDELTWTFAPAGFFEQPKIVRMENFSVEIFPGKVRAMVPSVYFDSNPGVRATIEFVIANEFSARQLCTYIDFGIQFEGRYRLHSNGRRDTYIETTVGTAIAAGTTADIRYTTSDGVQIDPKAERLRRQERMSGLLHKHGADAKLVKILLSFRAATKDPGNALIYFYEIMESLGDKRQISSRYNVPATKVELLKKLCNDPTLRQGRHRGQAALLRDATPDELMEAKNITALLVVAFAEYLDAKIAY